MTVDCTPYWCIDWGSSPLWCCNGLYIFNSLQCSSYFLYSGSLGVSSLAPLTSLQLRRKHTRILHRTATTNTHPFQIVPPVRPPPLILCVYYGNLEIKVCVTLSMLYACATYCHIILYILSMNNS